MSRRQLPRGTAAQLDAATFLPGEIAVDTTNDELRYDGDGSTVGGIKVARKDGVGTTVTATGSSTARTLADWFQGYARGSETPDSLGHFTDKGDGVLLHRFQDRVFIGSFNDNDGSTDGGSGQTWIANESLGDWIERSSTLGAQSTIGGIAVHGSSRVSDRYTVNGVAVAPWVTATVYAAGAYSARAGKIYQTAAGGTSGVTPPTHTTGNASDGAVTWTFIEYAYGAPIGIQGTAIYDTTPDGQAAWAAHLLSVRKSGGGTIYGLEIDLLNRGSDVTNNPYSVTPAGSTVGIWLAAGYDDLLASVNPATCAILIGQADSTWNSGIVFESDGITSGGYAIKYAAVAEHAQGWFNSSGQPVATLYSLGTANNERVAVQMGDRKISFLAVAGVMGTFESAASAGTAADEHVRLIGYAAGNGFAEVRAGGTASDVTLKLAGKGSGGVAITNANLTTPKGVWYTIASSAVQIVRNSVNGAGDATDTAQVTIAIPAGAMGPNGSWRLTFLGSHTNSVNVKTWRVYFGASGAGVGGSNYYSVAATSTATLQIQITGRNRNSASSQASFTVASSTSYAQSTGTIKTSAINTANATEVVISNLWAGATSGEAMNVEAYHLEVFYGA